tara:strand:- start:14415 stop:15503 length:1089 start_codon:yes stop_codon:yes gene_type:complete
LSLKLSYFSLALFIIQPFSWISSFYFLNLSFLILPFLHLFIKGKLRYLDKSVSLSILVIFSGSFLFSNTFADFYLIISKILTCTVVGLIGYHFGLNKGFFKYFLLSIVIFLLSDSLFRYFCFKPDFFDLLVGSIAYKRECTMPFTDSNASGIALIQLLAILHLFFVYKNITFLKWIVSWLFIICLLLLTASKAAIIVGIMLYPLLVIYEKIIKKPHTRVFFLFFLLSVSATSIISLTELDESFDTKILFLFSFVETLINNPLSILFGHGYVSGMSILAGDQEFAHIMPALLLGSIGIIGSIFYYYLMWGCYVRYSASFTPIVMIFLLSLSYFPPFFEYFIFLAFLYMGVAFRFNNLVSKHER